MFLHLHGWVSLLLYRFTNFYSFPDMEITWLAHFTCGSCNKVFLCALLIASLS